MIEEPLFTYAEYEKAFNDPELSELRDSMFEIVFKDLDELNT